MELWNVYKYVYISINLISYTANRSIKMLWTYLQLITDNENWKQNILETSFM